MMMSLGDESTFNICVTTAIVGYVKVPGTLPKVFQILKRYVERENKYDKNNEKLVTIIVLYLRSYNCHRDRKMTRSLGEEPSQINVILQQKLQAAKLRTVFTLYKQ